jgi:signal transduction histidine kinase
MNNAITMAGRRQRLALPLPYEAWHDKIMMPSRPVLAQRDRKDSGRQLLRLAAEPFTLRAIKERQYAVASFVLAVPTFAVMLGALALSLGLSLSFAGMLVGLPLLLGSLLAARQLAAVQRQLAAGLLGLQVPAPTPVHADGGALRRAQAILTDSATWRSCAYLLLRLPVTVIGALFVVFFWVYGLPFLTFPLWWLPLHAFVAHGGQLHLAPWLAGWWDPLDDVLLIHTFPAALALIPVGLAVVLTTPWRVRATAIMDGALINALCGPAAPSQRVRDLEQTRARAVDDADARLRQIERDLHDGAQAQMVAVAMKLGLAREKLGGTTGRSAEADLMRALELVDAAHTSARRAISELRDLARGIHPPVLDHGLATALAALAEGSGLIVDLVTDLSEPPSSAIETIGYFCAAELLANVSKHSGSQHATLEAVHVPGLLRVRVSDEGAGGARILAGGGLSGLADRLRTVDGKLAISSPPGGPTVVTVELPSHA